MKIPNPFAIAIDDLGWIEGKNEGYLGDGPYRVGLKRKMSLEDYYPLIKIAKQAGVRLQGLFILGEMDRENVTKAHHSMVPPNKVWSNKNEDLQIKMMEYVKANSAFLEFGLHGIGHEYWPNPNSDEFKRAEWYNLDDKSPWPEDSLRIHLETFQKIMGQYGLSKSNNQSFPESFVPCAYSYYWNPILKNNSYSLGALLHEFGVKHANTDFTKIPECEPPIDAGFDNGVHVMNRFNFGNLWHMIGQTPTIPLKYQTTQYVETHWPNILAQDDFLQDSVIELWTDYFKAVNKLDDRYASKNTAEHHSQFLYQKYCKVKQIDESTFEIDNTKMPMNKDIDSILQNLVLKVRLPIGQHLSTIELDGKHIPAYNEDQTFAYIYLPKLINKTYQLKYDIGASIPKEIIWHDSTSNIYAVNSINQQEVEIQGRFYGNQTISYITDSVVDHVKSDNELLKIISWKQNEGKLSVQFEAADMQGVTSSIFISRSTVS